MGCLRNDFFSALSMRTNAIGECGSSTDEWDLEHAPIDRFGLPFSQLPNRVAQRCAAQMYLLQRLKIAHVEGYETDNQKSGLWCAGIGPQRSGSLAHLFARLVDEPHPQVPQRTYGLPFEAAARGLDAILNDPLFIHHLAEHRYHLNTALRLGRLRPDIAVLIPAASSATVDDALLTIRKDIARTIDDRGDPIVQVSFVFPYVEGEGEWLLRQPFPVPLGRMDALDQSSA